VNDTAVLAGDELDAAIEHARAAADGERSPLIERCGLAAGGSA
jgi:hypothetical protein